MSSSQAAGGDAIDVSVLVPVLNEERHIRQAVRSMREQRFDGPIELIFVDGGSDDATRSILEQVAREDSRVRVLDNPARRTPNGLNVGLRAARGEYIARMDAHTRYPREYLARAVERLRRGDTAHVSGPQIPEGDGPWSRRIALALSTRLGTGGASFRRSGLEEFEVDSGFTGVWRRETLEAQGGWDEGWPINQDAELAARIRAGGGRIVCLPELAAQYIPRDSVRTLARQYWRYGVYRAKTSRRHPESMRRSHVLAPALAVALLVAPLPLGGAARAARAALVVYAAAVLAVSAHSAPRASVRDAAWLPLVFAAMHVSWGLGFVWGSLRFGPPVAGVARALRP